MLDDQADTDGGGEVHDGMSVGAELSDESCIEHASLDQLETSAPAQLVQVVERSCGEVVESTDLVAFTDEQIAEVATDETGPTRHQDSHWRTPFLVCGSVARLAQVELARNATEAGKAVGAPDERRRRFPLWTSTR